MKLPHIENAVVSLDKARYLLDANHRDNKGKAAFFLAFGFRLDAPEILAVALLRHVLENDVVDVQQHPYGLCPEGSVDSPTALV